MADDKIHAETFYSESFKSDSKLCSNYFQFRPLSATSELNES